MPNPNTIPWLHYQDIQIPDSTLQQQLQQYWASGNYSDALTLLTNNATQLQGKAFIASAINTITSGISMLENKYYQGVTVFLANLTSQYNTLINNFINKKSWFSTVQYVPYNFVVYQSKIYMCFSQPPIGTLPTNTTYWLYLDLQGAQGVPGVDVNMRYDWNATDTYNPNDLVVYGSTIYVALQTNTGVTPGTDPSIWLVFLVAAPGQIYVGTAAPQYPQQDVIWFQTQVDPLAQTTTTPIIGLFNRYNEGSASWEPMYPNTVFTWIDGTANYAPSLVVENVTIQPTDWSSQQYTYGYAGLTANSFVKVLPVSTFSDEQYALYNTLTISISGTDIVLTTTQTTPTVALPIRIEIQ